VQTVSTIRLLALGFLAGFAATLIFHQSVWYLLNLAEALPPNRPAWPLTPVPPLDIPSIISKAFWGGLWGAVLALFLARIQGATYWVAWIVVGAVAPSLVAMYIVPLIKGLPIGPFWPRAGIAAIVNGAWGLGAGLFLWGLGGTRT